MKIEITEQQLELINGTLLNESGIRDINKLADRYSKAEIYLVPLISYKLVFVISFVCPISN